jgi:threonine/homoserine/homoserine lactone efflux protein
MTAGVLLSIWSLHLLAAVSPGPAILMAARIGVTEGFRTAIWLCLGMGIGAMVWALAALFGLAALFHVAPAALWAFKVAGGLFLCWIALQMWRHAAEPLPEAAPAAAPRGALAALRLGLLTQLSNPKPAVFFGAVFVNTVPAGTTAGWLAVILGLVFLNEIVATLSVARAFSLAATRRAYARMKTGIDRSFGAVLGALGVKVALT